jgi:hypothetical protein
MGTPCAHPHGKGLASASGSEAAKEEEIVEEEEGNDWANGDDEEEEEETFIVDEINPSSYVHMGTPAFQLPLNLDWREKIRYEEKADLVREKRKENPSFLKKNLTLATYFTWHFSRTSMSLSTFPITRLWLLLSG